MTLQTARCFLRRFATGDCDLYHLLTGDSRVMRYVTGRPFTPAETAKKFERILRNAGGDDRAGVYAIHESATGAFLGAAAMLPEPSGRVELGYRIVHAHWGRGFATEVAAELLRYGVEVLRATTVVAYVDAENAASIRVLEKIGMERSTTRSENGRLEQEYQSEAPRARGT